MSTSVGNRYSDPEAIAAGNKSNIKKRLSTPDIFPSAKRPKLSNVKESIRGATVNISQPFMPPASSGIRSGSAKQLLRQLGAMSGDMPALAYAHKPIHVISPDFCSSNIVSPIADTGEPTMVFILERPAAGKQVRGAGLRLTNLHLAMLTLDRGRFFKKGYEVAAADLRLMKLEDEDVIASFCAYLGPVYINDASDGLPINLNAKTKAASSPKTALAVQVLGLAEGSSMKDLWPEAPVGSRLFLEIRLVEFSKSTTFYFASPIPLNSRAFSNKAVRSTYQIVPTFIPPDTSDYMANYATNDAYAYPGNWRVQVGTLVHRTARNNSHSKFRVSAEELSRGSCWATCGDIKVILSSYPVWIKAPINVTKLSPPAYGSKKPPAPVSIDSSDSDSEGGSDYEDGDGLAISPSDDDDEKSTVEGDDDEEGDDDAAEESLPRTRKAPEKSARPASATTLDDEDESPSTMFV